MSLLSIDLPPDLDALLEAAAARRGATKADVAKTLIATGLANEPAATGAVATEGTPPQPQPARPRGPRRIPRPGSALELAGDLVGCVEGPGDLSTNPKYMEDYGR